MATIVPYLASNDLDATLKWYCDALGFKYDKAQYYPGMFAHIYLDGSDARSSRAQLMLRSYPRPDKGENVAPGAKPPPMKFFFDLGDKAKVDEKYGTILKAQQGGLAVDSLDAPTDEQRAGYRAFGLVDPSGHEIAFFAWI